MNINANANRCMVMLLLSSIVFPSYAKTISDIDLASFNFDVVNYDMGSSSNGLGGDATASGTSNGIPWGISPTSLWSGRTTTDETFNFSTLPNSTDNLHPSGDYTITFSRTIDSLLVALSNNGNGTDSINFNVVPSDFSGVTMSGTQVELNNASGGLVLFENINSLTIHNVNNNGINDGYNLAFHVVATVPIPVAKDTQQHLLTDPELDAVSQSLLPFTQPILGRWMEENAELVIGTQDNGVAPSGGTGMVALFETGGVVSQVRQRVDVSYLADKIDKGLITAYALGRVNASEAGVVGGTQVSAMSDNSGAGPSGTLGFGKGGEFILDGDPNTWETIFSYLVLPAGTKAVEFQFLFTNESLEGGKIGYGDEAILVLSEWSDGTETCDFNDPNAIMGTSGNDTLLGTPGKDIIFGLEGNDTIFGFGGDDCINGGAGTDKIFGGPGTNICEEGESVFQCN
jgi:hypothetical protein